ncbi:hypothetical protein Hanom_Chr04g00317461 [Helianthus anomalus]
MALTWATRVRFGCATKRGDRENELHLAANAYGSLGHRAGKKKRLFLLVIYVFMCFEMFWAFCF